MTVTRLGPDEYVANIMRADGQLIDRNAGGYDPIRSIATKAFGRAQRAIEEARRIIDDGGVS